MLGAKIKSPWKLISENERVYEQKKTAVPIKYRRFL